MVFFVQGSRCGSKAGGIDGKNYQGGREEQTDRDLNRGERGREREGRFLLISSCFCAFHSGPVCSCVASYDPVCAANGRAYINQCFAKYVVQKSYI